MFAKSVQLGLHLTQKVHKIQQKSHAVMYFLYCYCIYIIEVNGQNGLGIRNMPFLKQPGKTDQAHIFLSYLFPIPLPFCHVHSDIYNTVCLFTCGIFLIAVQFYPSLNVSISIKTSSESFWYRRKLIRRNKLTTINFGERKRELWNSEIFLIRNGQCYDE